MDSFDECTSLILSIDKFIVNKEENVFFLIGYEEAASEDSNGIEFSTEYTNEIEKLTPYAYDKLIGEEVIILHEVKYMQGTVSKGFKYEYGNPIGVFH